jgi:hypothetical protein
MSDAKRVCGALKLLSQKSNSKMEKSSPIDLPQLSQESMLRAWYREVFKHAVRIESKDYGREVSYK